LSYGKIGSRRCILISLKTRETVSNKGSVRFVELDKRLHVVHNTEDKAYSLHNYSVLMRTPLSIMYDCFTFEVRECGIRVCHLVV